MQSYIEGVANTAGILEVRCGGAIAVVIVLPIGHEQPLDGIAGVAQQQGRNGGVNAS